MTTKPTTPRQDSPNDAGILMGLRLAKRLGREAVVEMDQATAGVLTRIEAAIDQRIAKIREEIEAVPATKKLGLRTYDTMHTPTPAKRPQSPVVPEHGWPSTESWGNSFRHYAHRLEDYALALEAAARAHLARIEAHENAIWKSGANSVMESAAALRRAMGEEPGR